MSADGIISDPSRGENCLLIATDGSGLGADYYCIRIYTKMIKKNKLFRVSLLHKDVSLVSWCVKNKVFEILFGLTSFSCSTQGWVKETLYSQCSIFFNKVHTNYNKWRESLFQLWSNIWSRFHVLRQAISKVLLVRIDYGCWWGGEKPTGRTSPRQRWSGRRTVPRWTAWWARTGTRRLCSPTGPPVALWQSTFSASHQKPAGRGRKRSCLHCMY